MEERLGYVSMHEIGVHKVEVKCGICGKKHYMPKILADLVKDTFGPDPDGSLVVGMCHECEVREEAKRKAGEAGVDMAKALADYYFGQYMVPMVSKSCRFGNFDTYSEMDRKHAQAFLDFTDNDMLLLAVGGTTGTGKTHLAVASLYRCAQKGMESCLYVTEAEMAAHLRDFSEKGSSTRKIITMYSSISYLVIDELLRTTVPDWVKDNIRTILQNRLDTEKKTVVLGNIELAQFDSYFGEAILSRAAERGTRLRRDGDDMRKKKRQAEKEAARNAR